MGTTSREEMDGAAAAAASSAESEGGLEEAPAKPETLEAAEEALEAEVEDDPAEDPPEDPPEDKPQAQVRDPRDDRIRMLERTLVDKEELLRDYIRAHKKAQADMEAFKERMRRDIGEQIEAEKGQVLQKMLEVADNMERSLEAARSGQGGFESLREGMELVYRGFYQALESLGLEKYDPTGEAFDPNSMEALGVIPVADPAMDGKVVGCLKAGFRMGERELRPALVQVGKKV